MISTLREVVGTHVEFPDDISIYIVKGCKRELYTGTNKIMMWY